MTPGFVKVSIVRGFRSQTYKRLPTSMFCQDAVDPMRLLEENLTDEEETGGKRCCLCAKSCSFMGFCSVLSQDIVDCNPVGASQSWLIDEMSELNSCILPAQISIER